MAQTGIPDPHVLMQAYLAARYRVQLEGQWQPITIGAPAPVRLRRHVAHAPCALLTAFNPGSLVHEEADNRRADAALQAALDAACGQRLPSLASADDGQWPEPGWLAVGLTPQAADTLARRFGQIDLLCWKADDVVRLRMLHRRPRAASATFVDWMAPD